MQRDLSANIESTQSTPLSLTTHYPRLKAVNRQHALVLDSTIISPCSARSSTANAAIMFGVLRPPSPPERRSAPAPTGSSPPPRSLAPMPPSDFSQPRRPPRRHQRLGRQPRFRNCDRPLTFQSSLAQVRPRRQLREPSKSHPRPTKAQARREQTAGVPIQDAGNCEEGWDVEGGDGDAGAQSWPIGGFERASYIATNE